MKLYFATHNRNKYEEAYRIMETYGVHLIPLDIDKIEIQSDDIGKIALFAARQAYSVVKSPVIVDDTGLYIEALNGFPGPYAEYVYRTIGLNGILKLLLEEKNRRAYFETALACVCPPWEKIFKEKVEGKIVTRPRGEKGFGYDPIFSPLGTEKTFAEMSIEEKNRYSHRAKAFHRLGKWITTLKKRRPEYFKKEK